MIPGLQQIPEGQIIAFALVFLRLMAFVIAWPIFGTQTVPVHLKVLFALALAVVLFPTVGFKNVDLLKISDEIYFLAIRELFVGLFLGFLMRMFFFTVSIAGEIIGVSSGLASAQLYNPTMGAQSNVIEQFHVMLASLLFLALDGHHIFLQGLAESFQLVPVSDVAVHSKAFSSLAMIIKDVFAMGLKIAAPVMIAILLTNVAMGLVGRAVPQMNVLMTSLQITIVIGVGVVIISMPLFIDEVGILMKVMANQFFVAMKVL